MPRELTVLTPEKVEITFRIAEIPSRAVAYLLDLVAVAVGLGILITIATLALDALHAPAGAVLIFQTVVGWLSAVCVYTSGIFFLIFMRGRTPGKAIMGLRVTMANGAPITTQAAIIRQLMVFADFLPSMFLAGVAAMFLSEKGQRFGDMVAGTIVIVSKQKTLPTVREMRMARAEYQNPLEAHVGSVSQLNEMDLKAIRALVGRYAELEPKVRERLWHQVWRSLVGRLEYDLPPDASALSLLQAIAAKLERDLEARQP